MFVVISHMRYAGAFSAVKADVAMSLEDAKKKAYDVLYDYYTQYCDDEGDEQEFKLVSLSDNDSSLLMMMDTLEQYTYLGGYGEVVTISEC
jgi:hypothetical protein